MVTKGIIYKGRPHLIEDEHPSPVRKGITVYRLRPLTKSGKPSKNLVIVTGREKPGGS